MFYRFYFNQNKTPKTTTTFLTTTRLRLSDESNKGRMWNVLLETIALKRDEKFCVLHFSTLTWHDFCSDICQITRCKNQEIAE